MTEVLFVGTADAFGAGGRRQAALVVRGRSGSLLLDCGPTTPSGLAAVGIEREEISAIVLTHFHGDHFGGLPLLLLASIYQDRRRRPLEVIGPAGVEGRVRALAEALGHPLEDRPWGFELRFRAFDPGEPVPLPGGARLRACPVRHEPASSPHGVAIEMGGRRLAYTGDTGWFDALPDLVKGCDLAVCECTFFDRDFEYHLSYETLLAARARFDCGEIVLTHLGEEMSARRGELELPTADDGLRIEF